MKEVKYICEQNHEFEHTAKLITVKDNITLEQSICPYCQTIIYRENKQENKITSVISVDLDKVDEKLKDGYIVESLYAKTATLVKRE
jgi:hypothetical protein